MVDSFGLNDAGLDKDGALKLVELLHLCKQFGVMRPLGQTPFAPALDIGLDGSVFPPELFLELEHAGLEARLEPFEKGLALLRMKENAELLSLATRFQARGLNGDEFFAPVRPAELVLSNQGSRRIRPTSLLVRRALLDVQREHQVLPEEDPIHLVPANKTLHLLLRWTQVHLVERSDERSCRLRSWRLSLKLVCRQGGGGLADRISHRDSPHD